MYDYTALFDEMGQKQISVRKLSRVTGIALSTLHDKLHGRSEFKASEMHLICKALGTDALELLFFTPKVRNNEQDHKQETPND